MEILKPLLKKGKKILLFVIDGIGDLPLEDKTPLELAKTPNLDKLAKKGVLGLIDPVFPGITPGSGPAHLSLFGYDPLKYVIGRGVLEALGVGVSLEKDALAVRANFATINEKNIIVDRRAGRIETEKARILVEKLKREINEIKGVKIEFYPGKEHRFVIVFHHSNLLEKIRDTDPQKDGKEPYPPLPEVPEANWTSEVIKELIQKIREVLKEEKNANFVLLRGFAKLPSLEKFPDRYSLKSLALAYYPMYRGLAKLVGMEVLPDIEDFPCAIKVLKEINEEYDFIYLHFKETDKAGEDGNFEKKKEEIEKVDSFIPEILKCNFGVIAITADHSTPCALKSHSWHPSPLLLYSPFAGTDECVRFTEKEAIKGYLGRIYGTQLMPLLLSNAGRLEKFGA